MPKKPKQFFLDLIVVILTIILLFLIFFKFANSTMIAPSAQSVTDPSKQQITEDDWWLPEWVKPFPDVIGFYGSNPDDIREQTLKLVTFRWRDVNPQEGVYDWSILENALKQPQNIYIRMENSDVIHCPEWLSKKYPDLEPIKISSYKDNFEVDSKGLFYPMWHPGFKEEFKNLLKSFKQHQFGSHPHLKFAYIPGAWQSGEFDITFVKDMKAKGMNAKDFLKWFQEIIDAYVDAFGKENAYKLMYTGYDVIPIADGDVEWRQALGRELFRYVIEQGGSTRFGLLEKYNFMMTDMPNYGIRVENIGGIRYMITYDNSLLIADPKRFIGSESEEIDNENITVSTYYQLKMSVLKNLQVRSNVVFLGKDIWKQAPKLHQYMLKTLGRNYHNSPDAWCALREGKDIYQLWSRFDLGEQDGWWIRNFERWLFQREVEPDGHTVRTYYVKTPVEHNEESYEALRTDTKNGSNYIYFGVDDKFMKGGSNNIQIKVTFLDDNTNTWWIEYDAFSDDFYKKSSVIKNEGIGKWKTVTFEINDATFLNRQINNNDFRIYNGGKEDISVRFVRVIKLDQPAVE
ncbi:hypothetical protein NIES4071_46550 [Calothrix sp. NIES-4071]|nr:hypothetical protein NIES4071_46550 [Calothrix sp. NIES-4071]BAZ58966.1 hypothetical protein NIES4105_46480 [Calothrix sp. NIES-4105]